MELLKLLLTQSQEELKTSLMVALKEFYPNPSTEQLLYVYDDRLRLSFPCTESITVNIDTINGFLYDYNVNILD